MNKYLFQDFMYVHDKLYVKSTEEEFEKKEAKYWENEEDFWGKTLNMNGMEKFNLTLYLEWEEITGPIKIMQFDSEYQFSQEEIIKIIKAFGIKEEI